MRELRALEGEVQRTGTQAQLLVGKALQALSHADPAVYDAVIGGDDEVDQLYLDVERRILGLFTLQTPVASDLRLLTALLHINLHLERVGDQAVSMARITKLADGLPPNPRCCSALRKWVRSRLGWWGRRWMRLRAATSNSRAAFPRWPIPLSG